MKIFKYGILILLAGTLFLASCMKDNFDLELLSDEMETEPALALPLIYGGFDMDNLAEVIADEDYSLEDEDGDRYYLVYPDTIYWLDETVEFGSELNQDVVTYFQIDVNSLNELAIRMALQIYMEDENHVVLDSVFDGRGVMLDPAIVDADGKLIEATEDDISSTFDTDKISLISDVAYMRVRAGMHSAKGDDDDFVKIYAEYALDYKISFVVNAILNTGDLN